MSTPGWGLSGWGDPLVPLTGDQFDLLLSHQCAIYRIAGGSPNKYNVPSQAAVLVLDNVQCRLSTLGGSAPQAGQEFVTPKQVALDHFKIFMRAQVEKITPANFIVIENRYFNVLSVLELRGRNNQVIHHLEIFVEETHPSDFL